jgi:hypothetical protein
MRLLDGLTSIAHPGKGIYNGADSLSQQSDRSRRFVGTGMRVLATRNAARDHCGRWVDVVRAVS